MSFYNESPQGAVYPTPIVGMLGVLDDVYAHRPSVARDGDAIVLLGDDASGARRQRSACRDPRRRSPAVRRRSTSRPRSRFAACSPTHRSARMRTTCPKGVSVSRSRRCASAPGSARPSECVPRIRRGHCSASRRRARCSRANLTMSIGCLSARRRRAFPRQVIGVLGGADLVVDKSLRRVGRRSHACVRSTRSRPSWTDDEARRPVRRVHAAGVVVHVRRLTAGRGRRARGARRQGGRGDVCGRLSVQLRAAVRAGADNEARDRAATAHVRPASVETTTQPETGKPVSLSAWYIRNAKGDYACTEFEEVGVRCQVEADRRGDVREREARRVLRYAAQGERAFSSVRKAARPVRIAGQQGTCFEAVPVSASPGAGSPAPSRPTVSGTSSATPTTGSFSAAGGRPWTRAGQRIEAESFVEVTSLSRVVEPRELRLPGPSWILAIYRNKTARTPWTDCADQTRDLADASMTTP